MSIRLGWERPPRNNCYSIDCTAPVATGRAFMLGSPRRPIDMTKAAEAEAIFARYPTTVGEIARAARALLLARLPGAEEQPDAAANVVGYGYGAGYKGLIATIILSKGGVKLGLTKGAGLPDPH